MRREVIFALLLIAIIFTWVYQGFWPITDLDQWRAKYKTQKEYGVDFRNYEMYDHSGGETPFITLDFLKGKHFWHPQVAIWLEDSTGMYLQTLLVTTSTAKGLFYAGRSSDNFKNFDLKKSKQNEELRRVDALPYWSHKRGVKYQDGIYSPPTDQPLPDGITGATPTGSFFFTSYDSVFSKLSKFKILVEINVAFDQNEYFSEFDFVEDSIYHSGTGLLGQPSVIYAKTISKSDTNNYYVLDLVGHGHHSGANGELYTNLNTLTTARYLTERIVVGVNERWYHFKRN